MSDPILSREALAQALDDLRIAGTTDRVTASSAEVLVLDHDLALRAENTRLREERDEAVRSVEGQRERIGAWSAEWSGRLVTLEALLRRWMVGLQPVGDYTVLDNTLAALGDQAAPTDRECEYDAVGRCTVEHDHGVTLPAAPQVAPTEPTCGTIPPNVLTHTLCLLPNEHAGPHEYERRCADRIDAWGDQTWRFCDRPLGHQGPHQSPDGTTWPAAAQVAPEPERCPTCESRDRAVLLAPCISYALNEGGDDWLPRSDPWHSAPPEGEQG